MPWSSGTFSRTNGVNTGTTTWAQDEAAGTDILSTRHDTHDQDIATGLNQCVNKDGSNAFTGDANLGSNKLTAVADGTALTDGANVSQIQDGSFIWCGTAGGTADAITFTPSPAITAYATGQEFRWKASANANTGAATVAISGLPSPKALEINDSALSAGDHAANKYYRGIYDGTAFQIEQISADASVSAASNGGASVSSNAVSVDPNNATDTTITAGDEILFADADDSNAVKKDTVQGILDLVTSDLPRGYLSGLTISNDTDADHDIFIAVGECRDAEDSVDMVLASAITKQIDATWASGDDAGGMEDGDTVGNTECFHVHLLSSADGATVDAGFDTSLTATNLLADAAVVAAGLTKYRRIGSVLTDGSANILGFTQTGDTFVWDDPPTDVSETADTSGALKALSVPTGVKVNAFGLASLTSGNSYIYVSSPDADNEAASAILSQAGDPGANWAGYFEAVTNTSAQVRYRAQSASGNATIVTQGWEDPRGKD